MPLRACALALLALPGCRGPEAAPGPAPAPREGLVSRIDRAVDGAARFLSARQAPDGAWRSEVYGPFRDGPALTPRVLGSLSALPDRSPAVERALEKGLGYLAGLAREDGSVDAGREVIGFPVYSSAEASALLRKSGRHAKAADAWLGLLRRHQLVEALGWSPADPYYGGWGYAVAPPRKGAAPLLAGSPVQANLSATLFALEALRAADVAASDPAYRKALVFIGRCQNFAGERKPELRFDDGGFFFIPDDPAKNKAGASGRDAAGRTRFASYGSMTADGLQALLRCGLPPDHPRVTAARRWLREHFAPDTNPGRFAPDREVIRNATYYYYCRSVARALGEPGIPDTASGAEWARALAEELIGRQRSDGSWSNRYTDTKEDDPLVATPAAAEGLSIAYSVLRMESVPAAGPAVR